MAELVDALDSKSCSFGSAGSIQASGTKEETFSRESPFFVNLKTVYKNLIVQSILLKQRCIKDVSKIIFSLNKFEEKNQL